MYSGGVDSLPAFFVLAIIGTTIAFLATSKRTDVRRGWVMIALYLAVLLSVVFFPLPITREAIEYGRWRAAQGLGQKNNFQLFAMIQSTWGRPSFIRQVVGNIALLYPLGLILGATVINCKKRKLIAIILLTAVTIEILQATMTAIYGFPFRSFDVDDLWLDTAGGICGFFTAKMIQHFWPSISDWTQSHRLTIGIFARENQNPRPVEAEGSRS